MKSFIGCVIYFAQFLLKLSELIKPINDILKKCNKVNKADKICPLANYNKGKGSGRKRYPDIQKFWMPIHTKDFEAIKSLIVDAPFLHLPTRTGHFYLECDSSAKNVGSVLYQIQNGNKHIIAFYSATMPDAASHYSSSELELCGLKKSVLHFQYLLKYSTFTVLMDHSALKYISCSKKPTETVRIQKVLEQISDFSFDLEHISGKHIMFFSDFLFRFSGQCLSYMSYLDNMCNFNYKTQQGICTKHSFPLMRSQAKLQKIAIPTLFKGGMTTICPKKRPSLLRDPPDVLAGKRSTAPTPADLGTTTHKKRGRCRPLLHRVQQPTSTIPDEDPDDLQDIETLPTFPVRRRLRNRQPVLPAQPLIFQPDATLPYFEEETAIKQIYSRNLHDNIDLMRRTVPARPNAHDTIPLVIEDHQPINMDRHFPSFLPLTSAFTKGRKLKTCRDVPHQKVIDKIVVQLNSKTMHFYNLRFALDTLRKGQQKGTFFLVSLVILRITTYQTTSNFSSLLLLKPKTICCLTPYCFISQLNHQKLLNINYHSAFHSN